MSGKFSRCKGRRGEQQLVLYLAKMGYKAERILNQARTAGLPDVKAVKEGKELTFELKTYQQAFTSIYKYYYSYKNQEENFVVSACLKEKGPFVAISTNLESLLERSDWFFAHPNESEKRVFKRLETLNEKRGKADYLVLKDNNKPRLFLRYWS